MTNHVGDDPDNAPPDVRALVMLHRAGWSIGDVVAKGLDGRPVWIVSGSNGENLIRVEGLSKVEAWLCAVESARSLGMLGRSTDDQLQSDQ